jgi:hypothetical protein
MATATMNTTAALDAAIPTTETRPSFFSRLLRAMIESRQRQAEIEVRRAMALYGEPKEKLDYALLPFAGE